MKGRVDTRTEEYKELTIYFKEVPEDLKENDAVSFDVVVAQKSGRPYAKFLPPVAEAPAEEPAAEEAPATEEGLERRGPFDEWPEQRGPFAGQELRRLFECQREFAEEFGPRLGLTLRANPTLLKSGRANGLYDATHGRYADLQIGRAPFFSPIGTATTPPIR